MGFAGDAAGWLFGKGGSSGALGTGTYTPPPIDINMMAGQQGLGQLQGVQGQQQGLADLLMASAQGQGPSAAQNQFQSALDQNLRSTQALGQSVPGASSGAALRSILEAQGQITGQAGAQSAALRAQEQMGARGQLGGLLGGMGQQSLEQMNLAQQMEKLRAQTALGQQSITAQAYEGGAQRKQQTAGGFLSGLGSKLIPFQVGGEVPDTPMSDLAQSVGTGNFWSQFQKALGQQQGMGGGQKMGVGIGQGLGALAQKGLGSLMSFGLSPGGTVPGQAPMMGDSSANDTVPAMLSPGEIVLPRSVTKSADAEERAKEFVAAIKAHKAGRMPSKGYGRVLAKRREAANRR